MEFSMGKIIKKDGEYYIICNDYDEVVKYVSDRSSEFEIEKINRKRKLLISTNSGKGFVLLKMVLNRLEAKREREFILISKGGIIDVEG
ncbi:hypothetical protein QJR26_17830 (plasmid) [Clostridium baratii]